ncbi:MAG: hypothetical protein GF333_02080 [Candidatus Omnitrophica bacterium]|nr:hypothetical protein [Candidatus Omnitrophota bacterium]
MKLADIDQGILVWGPVSEEGLDRLQAEGRLAVAAECRPFLVGLRYNVPRLQARGIRFVYCPDEAVGLLCGQGRLGKTFLFLRRFDRDTLTGLSGVGLAYVLSRLHGITIEEFLQGPLPAENWDPDAATLANKPVLPSIVPPGKVRSRETEMVRRIR